MNDYSKVVMLMGRYVLMSCLLMLGCAGYLTKTPHNVVALLAFMALLLTVRPFCCLLPLIAPPVLDKLQ